MDWKTKYLETILKMQMKASPRERVKKVPLQSVLEPYAT